MKLGFTGTRKGMTPQQKAVVALIFSPSVSEVHHGDCVGADSDFHEMAKRNGIRIVIHPPNTDSLRAFKEGDESRQPKGYLERDREIIKETEELLATPGEFNEVKRSGTWYTIRQARSLNKPIRIIWPDGTVKTENHG